MMEEPKPSTKPSKKKATEATEKATKKRKTTRTPAASESTSALDLAALIPLTGESQGQIALEVPKPQKQALLAVSKGAVPPVQTVIYVHGIGNKPPESVLRAQWDRALFGTPLGDRSRMAYWVDRQRYPEPEGGEGGNGVLAFPNNGVNAKMMFALANPTPVDEADAIEAQIRALTENEVQRAWLRQFAAETVEKERENAATVQQLAVQAANGGLHAADFGLPLPLMNALTFFVLPDVNDFFFHPERRARMEKSLLDRLQGGGGPFLIIGHSQGSMIAYNVLRRLAADAIDVPLFITIGSPLGLESVTQILHEWVGDDELPVPPCVKKWVNVADRFDIVAADGDLRDDYVPAELITNYLGFLNKDAGQPHSGTGYLRSNPVQNEVRAVAGPTFGQPIGKAVVMKDLVAEFEDREEGVRRPVLIQLKALPEGEPNPNAFASAQAILVQKLSEMVESHGVTVQKARIESFKRFVGAELTRLEVEQLRTLYPDLQIDKVWRDAAKHAQINKSTNTVQARPANLGYDALGKEIGWAVLDTGIQADHPHFATYKNVVCQWDCTQYGVPTVMQSTEGELLDGHGHGTHVAGIIAGYHTFKRVDQPDQTFAGMAPATSLYGFKVLDNRGNGQDSYTIKALDFIADLNERAGRLVIHGVNLSLGGNFDPSVYGCGHTPLCQELRRLWGQGVLVCLAAGNEGIAALRGNSGFVPELDGNGFVQSNLDFSISDPANLDEAIAVGSVHKENPYTYGVSFFSSRGPTADGRRKPDLVAPGEKILSAWNAFGLNKLAEKSQAQNTAKSTAKETAQDTAKAETPWTVDELYAEMSGTSMAAPHVSGLLAAFLSVRREFIDNPNRVKRILLENCSDLGRDGYSQGAGLPNLVRMLANT